MQLGVMRLMKKFPDISVATLDNLLTHIYNILSSQSNFFPTGVENYIGVGGTFSTLEILYHKRKSFGRSFFTKKQVSEKMIDLFSLSVAERELYPHMPPGRGDITPYGFAILYMLMEFFSFSTVEVVRKGNLDGWLIAHV